MEFERLDMGFLENPTWLRFLESLLRWRDWEMDGNGRIRRRASHQDAAGNDVYCCPLTAAGDASLLYYIQCGKLHGFTDAQAEVIASVADLKKSATALEQAMRAAMLQACHLTETSHDGA